MGASVYPMTIQARYLSLMKSSLRTLCMLAAVLFLSAGVAQANVVIGGTRVIFPASQGDVTVRLENKGTRPALIQAWIDRGNPQSRPDTAKAPFLITPPLFLIDAHKAQSLRIIFTHANLPGDRESLFWLNVLEIPPKPTKDELQGDKNYLQLAIRSRLKLFYRPDGLKGDPLKAPQKLTWHMVRAKSGWMLRADNPTPFHVTLSKVQLKVGGKVYAATTGMVDPMSSLTLHVKGLDQALPSDTPVTYDAINDFGAVASFKGTVAP